eukprot:scaffold148_cov371-Prasinococcus_capsulatus_cf.AAC.17
MSAFPYGDWRGPPPERAPPLVASAGRARRRAAVGCLTPPLRPTSGYKRRAGAGGTPQSHPSSAAGAVSVGYTGVWATGLAAPAGRRPVTHARPPGEDVGTTMAKGARSKKVPRPEQAEEEVDNRCGTEELVEEERDDIGAADDGKDVGETAEAVAAVQAQQAGPVVKKTKPAKAKKLQAELDNRGVIYLSYIPPKMSALKLRHLLSAYGEVLRIFLAPRGRDSRKARSESGNKTHKGRKYTEGWVEFADKRKAKRVALMLHGNVVGMSRGGGPPTVRTLVGEYLPRNAAAGGKKRSPLHDEIWSMQYLSKFKWSQLSEEIAYRKAIHEQRLQVEKSAATRERDFYLSQVDKAKAIDAMEARRRVRGTEAPSPSSRRGENRPSDTSSPAGAASATVEVSKEGKTAKPGKPAKQPEEHAEVRRTFSQKRKRTDPASRAAPMMSKKLISQIF